VRGGFYLYDPRFSEGAKILCEGWAEREAVCHIILHSPPACRGSGGSDSSYSPSTRKANGIMGPFHLVKILWSTSCAQDLT
jgi:hypothetical protein